MSQSNQLPDLWGLSNEALAEIISREQADARNQLGEATRAQTAMLARYGVGVDPKRVSRRLAYKLLQAAALFGTPVEPTLRPLGATDRVAGPNPKPLLYTLTIICPAGTTEVAAEALARQAQATHYRFTGRTLYLYEVPLTEDGINAMSVELARGGFHLEQLQLAEGQVKP